MTAIVYLYGRGCEANGAAQQQAASVLEVEIATPPTGPAPAVPRPRIG